MSLRKSERSQRRLWGDVFNQSPKRGFRDLQISPLSELRNCMGGLKDASEMHSCQLGCVCVFLSVFFFHDHASQECKGRARAFL